MTATPTVVVIDDDPSVRRALERLLAAAGYGVLVCSSAEEFLMLADLPSPACILLDIRMPGMTGLDLQEVLGRSGHPVPVILSSGHADAATATRAKAAGAKAFLSKPFDDEDLLAVLSSAFDDVSRNGRTP